MVKKISDYLLATKIVKNRPLCTFLPKISAYKILIRLDVCLFYKGWKIVRKISWNLEKTSATLWKKNLTVN